MKRNLLKVATMAMALACVCALAVGCSSGASSNSSSSSAAAASEQKGGIDKLIVGFDDSYPPYGYIGNDGEYVGFDLDLAKEVANRNGWEIELRPIDWDSKDAELNQGSINCIWNGFTQEGREGKYTFSQPYMLNEQVIVAKKDSGIKSADDLKDKVVITQTGSAAHDLLKEGGDFEDLAKTFKRLDTIADYNNAFMQLDSGTVEAVVCDLSIAQYNIAAKPDAYEMVEEPLSSEHYAVGFKLGDEELANVVSDTLIEMYNDGTVEEIAKKYESEGLKYDNWILK